MVVNQYQQNEQPHLTSMWTGFNIYLQYNSKEI